MRKEYAELGVNIKVPRLAEKQQHRYNVQSLSPEDYFKVSISNPYMNAIVTSKTTRFEKSNAIPFTGEILHSHLMKKEKTENEMDYLEAEIR